VMSRRGSQFVMGFVHFSRIEDAQRSKVELNGVNLPGGSFDIKVQDQERGTTEKSRSIRVHNVSPRSEYFQPM